EWCGPCKMIAPVVEQLATEYQGKLKVGKVDVDSNQQTAMQFAVRSIPTLLIFKNGKVVEQIVGAVPKAALADKVSKHLN
ncbi:MAG TPA: thioredoxin, partial [Bacteroidetes bacterium]|nr:thioredoxin [Bacteroidota bacterium]